MNGSLITWMFLFGLAAGPVHAQQVAPKQLAVEQEPPEEDLSFKAPTEYTFNPLQAEKEMKIGSFYFKRGSFPAAAMRFEEATKWNPALAEAWRRLGEARERLEDAPGAASAYAKALELAGDSKQAEAIRKRLAALNGQRNNKPTPKPATK